MPLISPPDRGYQQRLHDDPASVRGCICPEDLEHDGKCQNALRGKKVMKCQPCSQGWHYAYRCAEYKIKDWPGVYLTTQCDRCGWDQGEHALTEAQRKVIWQKRS